MSNDVEALAQAMAGARFRSFAPQFIKIEDENGEIVPLNLNEAQLIIDDEVERQMSCQRPVRMLILKGRQQGCSSYCQARIFHRSITVRTRSLTVGHVLPAVHELYGKFERAWKEIAKLEIAQELRRAGIDIQPPIEPGAGERNRRIVLADPLGSVIRYDSAADPETVGRGMTFQCFHATEIPQWAKPAETMQAVLATIPDSPHTMVFVETTAKGASGWFYDTWIEAIRDMERGVEPEFVPVFVPWYKTLRYRRKRRPGEPGLDKREKLWRDKYDLSNEQCYWYRDQRKKFGERVTEEYPSTWQEAFLSSGLPYFRREVMAEYRDSDNVREPDRVGNFRVYDRTKAAWEEVHGGPTHIFEGPEEGHRYSVGIDFASGRSTDFNTMVVIDADTKHIVATHQSKWLPDQSLDEAILLGKIYNNAILVPERNGIGQTLVDRLVNEIGYPNVYREDDPVAVKYHKGRRFGWATSTRTRQWMLEEMARLVHSREVVIPCRRLIGEMQTFVYTDEEGLRAAGQDNKNDDLVLAFAIAIRGLSQLPKARSSEAPKRRPPKPGISSRTGY